MCDLMWPQSLNIPHRRVSSELPPLPRLEWVVVLPSDKNEVAQHDRHLIVNCHNPCLGVGGDWASQWRHWSRAVYSVIASPYSSVFSVSLFASLSVPSKWWRNRPFFSNKETITERSPGWLYDEGERSDEEEWWARPRERRESEVKHRIQWWPDGRRLPTSTWPQRHEVLSLPIKPN